MTSLLRQLLWSRDGGTAIEYGLVAMLVSVSFIAGAILLGNEVGNLFNDVGSEVESAR